MMALDLETILPAVIGGAAGLIGGGSSQKPAGYQGKVPVYQAVRQQVPMAEQNPARRPGSGGRQYFTNTQYLPKTDATGIAAAQQAMQRQSDAIAQANLAPNQGQRTAMLNAAQSIYPMYTPYESTPPPKETEPSPTTPTQPEYYINDLGGGAHGGLVGYAQGGIANLGYYLGGATDGMADKIPARIGGKQEAKLSHGEFVIPADVVGHLGNGNSEAGAQRLYAMMDKIRKARTGTTKQGKQINPDKFLA